MVGGDKPKPYTVHFNLLILLKGQKPCVRKSPTLCLCCASQRSLVKLMAMIAGIAFPTPSIHFRKHIQSWPSHPALYHSQELSSICSERDRLPLLPSPSKSAPPASHFSLIGEPTSLGKMQRRLYILSRKNKLIYLLQKIIYYFP